MTDSNGAPQEVESAPEPVEGVETSESVPEQAESPEASAELPEVSGADAARGERTCSLDRGPGEHQGAQRCTGSTSSGEGSSSSGEGSTSDIPDEAALRERLLGSRLLALGTSARDRLIDRIGTAAIVVVAALARLIRLGTPSTLVFDETFYVKDAFTLWRLGFEAQWMPEPNAAFAEGIFNYIPEAAYVVHPQVGKWMIGAGIELGGGAGNPAAWRLANALIGILAVFLVIRIGRRLFASTWAGLAAGLLMAVDGTAIVHSRTALLDQFLMFWILVAFGCMVMDRMQARRRLAERVAGLDPGRLLYGPRLGMRWWRLGAGIALGLAVGTKWSGLYAVAAFGLLTVLWDATARRDAGIRRWWSGAAILDGIPAFGSIVGVALVTYVGSWWSWFATPGAWGRDWAANNPGEGVTWLPEILRSFVQYHQQMWGFHTGLTTPHTYQANPVGFIVQWRPTSFYWNSSGETTRAITSMGNPLLWWLAAAAGIFAIAWGAWHADWRALAALSGTLAGWLPWVLAYAQTQRTMFTFYTIAFTPFVVFTLVYAGVVACEWAGVLPSKAPKSPEPSDKTDDDGAAIEPPRPDRPLRRRRVVPAICATALGLIVVVSALYYPLWTAIEVPLDYWRALIPFRNWI